MAKVILISGCSGSGKTSVANALRLMRKNSAVVSLDWVYKNGVSNFDHPDAFDWELLLNGVATLRAGVAFDFPVYDYVTHSRIPDRYNRVEAGIQTVIVEGILALYSSEIRELADASIFVETELDECLSRRISRDVLHRGRTCESVIEQWRLQVKPAYVSFIEPSKRFAAFIINNSQELAHTMRDKAFSEIREMMTPDTHQEILVRPATPPPPLVDDTPIPPSGDNFVKMDINEVPTSSNQTTTNMEINAKEMATHLRNALSGMYHPE